MSPENKNPKDIPEIHFNPEGYIDTDGPEYYEQLVQRLTAEGFDPDQLLYSGTGLSAIKEPDGSIKQAEAVFAMNKTGWQNAIRGRETTPAGYAERWEDPCIVLLDRRNLAHAYSYETIQDEEDYNAPIEVTNIVPGDHLAGLPPNAAVEEVVIHKDHPHGSPADAIVGLVIIEQD